ncbi:MAG TPA: hypothetical protein PLR83_08285 [Pyrinomonadaceae bacterium]|nr:hypothetical protein [Pyrinomonadaceae bacterium]
MEKDKRSITEKNLFVLHRDEITKAYRRAVREALIKHKLAGNDVVTARDGKVVILRADEIDIEQLPE